MEKKPIMEETLIKESSRSSEDGSKEDDLVFPGFRFHPTDQELVGFYLKRKVERKRFSVDIIKDIDIYKRDPWDLPSEARHVAQGAEDKEWYFFCLRGRKYRNSIRPNRVTGSGFWKATGIDKPIHDGGAGECVGLKKSLVYYRGSAGKGTKTDWMMHEFRLPSASSSADFQDAEIWTICRIFKRNLSYNRRFQQQKQEHGNKRSRQQSQYYYYGGYHHHQQHPYIGSCASSMASSFESTTTDCQPPFQMRGFQGASPADVTMMRTSAATGTSPSASAWSELTTSFVRDGGSTATCWDELGRIMEISTDMTYM